jgi:hypothetical protein
MRNGKHTLISLVVVALAGLAVAIPAGQASGQSPDSRPYYRGTDPALAPKTTSPDDRAFSRAIPISSTTKIVSPDDRLFTRSTPTGPKTMPAAVPVQPRGFDWTDALIGGTFGLLLALLGAGAVAITLHHRRGVLRTA